MTTEETKALVEKYRADPTTKTLREIVEVAETLPPIDALEVYWHVKHIARGQFFPQMQAAADMTKFARKYGVYMLDGVKDNPCHDEWERRQKELSAREDSDDKRNT